VSDKVVNFPVDYLLDYYSLGFAQVQGHWLPGVLSL
jgi:hypothetical protein